MCMKQTCPTCGKCLRLYLYPSRCDTSMSVTDLFIAKQSWFGCGSHISRVMDAVPEAEWCQCAPKVTVDGKEYPPKAGTAS